MKKFFLLIFLTTIMSTSLIGCDLSSNTSHTNNATDNMNDSANDSATDGTESDTETSVKPNTLVVGMRIGDAFDLTAYNELLDELTSGNEILMDLKDVLPFETYIIVPEHGLVNTYEHYYEEEYGQSQYSIMSDSILGFRYSVMIVKMNDSDTYALLIRDSYTSGTRDCTYNDLSCYQIVAIDLTKEDVETMILPNSDYIQDEYLEEIMKQYRIASKEIDMLSEYVSTQSGNARYFIYNNETYDLEELHEGNLALLLDLNRVYVYFGNSPIPMPHETIIHVDTNFDENIESLSLSELIEEIQSYAIDIPEREEIKEDGFSSFDMPPVASQDLIDELIEIGYPSDMFDFSYKEWIDASNFPDNMCTDVGLLWVLSLINDEIGGDLLSRGKILTEAEVLKELNVGALPHTDMVGIINHDTANYCIIMRVHNETSIIEKTNVQSTFETLSTYRDTLQLSETESEESARRGVINTYAVGPYVWIMSLGENQGIDDYWDAVNYHAQEYNKICNRFYYLFDYLRALSIKNQDAGYSSSDNYWN